MLAAAFVPLFLACVLAAPVEAQHPNFSGTWKLNPLASNFAGGPSPKSMTIRIIHNDPALIVTSHTIGPQGDQAGEYRWWTDGYPAKNTIRGVEYDTSVTWEGSTLAATSKAKTEQGAVEMTDRWLLSDSGKKLTVSRVFRVGGKTVEQQYVYGKP